MNEAQALLDEATAKTTAYLAQHNLALVLLLVPRPTDADENVEGTHAILRNMASDATLAIGFDDYDKDPRAVEDIPEVQRFAAAVLQTGLDWNETILERLEPVSRVVLFKAAENTRTLPRFTVVRTTDASRLFMFLTSALPATVAEAVDYLGFT